MGKSKKRTLYKSNTSYFMTREEAVNKIFKSFCDRKKRYDYQKALDTISLFGISAEELSERGVPYENLKAISNVLS